MATDRAASKSSLSIWQQMRFLAPPILVGLLVAATAPREWDDTRGPISALTRFVADLIPSVSGFASISSFRGVTLTTLAVLWLLAPLLVVWFARQRGIFKLEEMGKLRHKVGFTLMLGICLAPVLLMPLILTFTEEDLRGGGITSLILVLVSTSRVGLGLVAGFAIWAWCMACALLISVIRNAGHLYRGDAR